MNNIYTGGQYLEQTPTWHSEDSPWKARQINQIIKKNQLQPSVIADIGCGVGSILYELSESANLATVKFKGYDISPHAIDVASKIENKNIEFFNNDLLTEQLHSTFDILLIIDVFEHVTDYLGFVEQCKGLAEYKIYHIPLDIHVSSVLRSAFVKNRYVNGHLHYFSAESALCTLKDTGHEIVDYCYTNGAFDLFWEHPSVKKAIANLPRWVISRFSTQLAARLFGGYSLLVLAK